MIFVINSLPIASLSTIHLYSFPSPFKRCTVGPSSLSHRKDAFSQVVPRLVTLHFISEVAVSAYVAMHGACVSPTVSISSSALRILSTKKGTLTEIQII